MTETLLRCDLLGELPSLAGQRWGERKALTFGGRVWNYQQFSEEVDAVARALHAIGVRCGDRVALWLPNCPEIQFLFFAVIKIGALAVPLNTRYRANELEFALKHSGARFLFGCARTATTDYDAILAEVLRPATAGGASIAFTGVPGLAAVVMLGDARLSGSAAWESFRANGEAALPTPVETQIRPSDAAMMMFTSGTTGRPKGVLLNHAGLRLCHDRARIMELDDRDVQLTYLPLFHIYAIGYSVIMSMMCGASQVLMEFFRGDEALRLIEQHRVTAIHGFEAHFADLLAAQAKARRDISSLRTASFATGADSVRPLAERVQTELCPTAASYGLTELWGGITITGPHATLSQRCEASGLPQPGIEVRIVDVDSGAVLPHGTVGEIQVRSYARLIEYYQDPAATAAALDEEGWFRTGDAGLLREDGHLRYFSRYKDMLKVGGENVAPAEIEELICKLAGVRAAAVVGQKSERLQEVPVAFVVTSADEPPTEASILEFMRGKIARFKLPARIVFVDELPMTSTGKVQKEVLRQRLRQEAV